MKTKQTFIRTLALGVVVGVLIGFAVWNVNRVSALKEVDGRVHFGIVTLLPAVQNARLNFVRVDGSGVEDPTNMQPCVIEVRTFDAAGRAYGTPDTIDLRPGIAVSRNIIPSGTTQIEGAFQFRATFKFIDDPNLRPTRCTVIPTMEVFNRETGGTLFNVSRRTRFQSTARPARTELNSQVCHLETGGNPFLNDIILFFNRKGEKNKMKRLIFYIALVMVGVSGAFFVGARAQIRERREKKPLMTSTIAFVSTRHDPTANLFASQIYLMNGDGTNVRRITNNKFADNFPTLSPDGSKIVFDSNRLRTEAEPINTSHLFLMNTDGTEQTLLARGGSPTWSPDGKKIAFHASASGTGLPTKPFPGAVTIDSDLFVMNVNDVLEKSRFAQKYHE